MAPWRLVAAVSAFVACLPMLTRAIRAESNEEEATLERSKSKSPIDSINISKANSAPDDSCIEPVKECADHSYQGGTDFDYLKCTRLYWCANTTQGLMALACTSDANKGKDKVVLNQMCWNGLPEKPLLCKNQGKCNR
mmetsp:Transcript_74455/g.172534  ORF Transcript_74455/g.172534 Transcript_74455/m.172534 type:complete len:138 (+) Transcript_74455:63-476(+)